MKFRILISLFACVAVPAAAHAETVSRKEANSIAGTFFNAAYGEVTAPPQMVWNGRQLTTDRLFSPIYVYNSPKGGYVIISGENKAYPILAYSKVRKFDKDKISDDEKEVLKTYAREIELIRYDPRIPAKAMEAWRNIPEYISAVLASPYDSDEYRALGEERKDMLESLARSGNQILMPSAVEFSLYDPDAYRELTLDDVTAADDEIPFKFYEDFIREVSRENRERDIKLEEIISPSRPVVKALGGGHFEISFPENIRMMRIYTIGGMQMMEKYYKETSLMNIDMSVLGSGYYIGLALADSGNVFGFKLYR
ncbi:MAG: Spi family protease inhibitor [Muribaculaceae bacterium]|nr:Spi family protease inhibitor [Muribaculaceae bacterium]ROS85257.1 hypothetical protein EEK90_03695 [Muribaculaceae bacterium Isolate-036 (Harlan)]ROT20551.1 hypothetical protein EEL52_10310 [Muribaculaceae bacterium Isolate-113 (HZI)]ROT24022.1 hypothetical protein EEL53_01600 [Muribaculaceae bacterium Isolate-114 (HZI)]RXE67093.1 hypothetical protein ED328_11840 [Muribaculaceae bacterium Isolate-001 (NCI)]